MVVSLGQQYNIGEKPTLYCTFTLIISCPLPPKPAGFGEWVWEGLSGGCRAGLTLKRCSQLAAFAIQPVGWDAAAVWLAEDDGVPRCAPLPEPQFGALREGGGTREAGSTVAESLVVLYYRVGTHQIRRRRRAARSLTSQGRAEPLCARITGLNREVSEGKADLWPRSFFFLRGPQGAANGQDSWGFFKNAQGFGRLDAGSRAGFTSSRPPPPWTSVFRFSLFLYKMCGLEKLGLVDQNWLERNFSGFLLRTLVVGRRQHSESIEVALEWSKEVWWTVLILVGAIACRAA